jgi:hypothetical protein
LLAIRTGLSLLPFNKVRRYLDWFASVFPGHQGISVYSQERIVWAVQVVGTRLLGDKPCLTQALAVQMLFKRRGVNSKLHIGIRKDTERKVLAHAWVEKDGQIVIGGEESPNEYLPLPPLG